MLENLQYNTSESLPGTRKKGKSSESPQVGKKPRACKCCGNKKLKKSGSKNGYTLWACSNCDFIFTDIDYADMVQNFISGFGNHSTAPSIYPTKSLEFLSPALSWLPDSELKIMDFGCGECTIPDRLRKEGHRVIAVDILPPKKHHPDRLTGDILELDIPAGTFDLIYSYDVFEQIPEPRHVLKKLSRLLKENGMLLIHSQMETPDRLNFDLEDSYFNPPVHCSYYRHKTFDHLLQEFGCRIIYKNSRMILAIKG